MFRLVDPRPVNVIMRALPMPPRKVTELLPLPAHPAQVKIPDVENVTGSALASDVLRVNIARSNALSSVPFKTLAICVFPLSSRLDYASAPTLKEGKRSRSLWHIGGLKLMFPQPWGKHGYGNIVQCLGFTHRIQRRQSLFHYFFRKRRRKPVAAPIKPVPSNNILAGSGTAVNASLSDPPS